MGPTSHVSDSLSPQSADAKGEKNQAEGEHKTQGEKSHAEEATTSNRC